MKNTPPTYSIKDWGKNFETAESRRCKNILWVSVPTKMSGRGFLRVSRHPQNSRIFAAWVLMLELAAMGTPRGTLATEDGPYTAEDMAMKTGFPEADFSLALEVLAQPAIGWIESTPGQPAVTPGDARAERNDAQDCPALPGDARERPGESGPKNKPRMNTENPGTPGHARECPVTPGDARATRQDITRQDIDVLLEKEPKGAAAPAPAVGGGGIANSSSPSIGEPFPSSDTENPGSGNARPTETATGNPARVTTNDEAFAAFLAAGPKLERPAPTEDDRPAKKAKAKKADEPMPPLPFPSEAFAEAWADFVDMRNRNRWKLTPRAVEIIFSDLTGMGEAKAIMALQNSTVKSWRGVFEPTERRYGGRAAEVARQANGKISTGIDYSKP